MTHDSRGNVDLTQEEGAELYAAAKALLDSWNADPEDDDAPLPYEARRNLAKVLSRIAQANGNPTRIEEK